MRTNWRQRAMRWILPKWSMDPVTKMQTISINLPSIASFSDHYQRLRGLSIRVAPRGTRWHEWIKFSFFVDVRAVSHVPLAKSMLQSTVYREMWNSVCQAAVAPLRTSASRSTAPKSTFQRLRMWESRPNYGKSISKSSRSIESSGQ